MAYSPTVWQNLTTPALNATNLNKLTNELAAQALANSISHTLPTWVNGIAPALSDAAPLNEMERVAQAVATARSLSYTPTAWQSGWSPPRNAANLNKLEQQVQANSQAVAPTAPGTTQALQATGGSNQVALSWTAPASDGGSAILGYIIYRGPTAGSEISLATKPGTGTTYTDSTAVGGNTYFYRVSAYNAIGEGVWSNEVSATATGSPPAGFAIPTYQVNCPALNGLTNVFLCHTSPNMYTYVGGNTLRAVHFPTHGYEYWCAFEVYIPASFGGASNFALPMDLHAIGGENGWNTVSCTHIKFKSGGLMLQHEPNAQNEWLFFPTPPRDTWHSILAHFIFGRLDGQFPQVGRTRLYVNGSNTPALDTGSINNVWGAGGAGAAKPTTLSCLEGTYNGSTSQAISARVTAARWGTTYASCLADSAITFTGTSIGGGATYTQIASRLSSDFQAPSNPA